MDLREDVEEVQDDVHSLRLRMLWLMSQEVRRERQEASKQVIIQGFEPRSEAATYSEAAARRDRFIKELLERLLGSSAGHLQYTSSHSTSLESLSRITILTFQQPHMATAVQRAAGTTKYSYGAARVMLRRQQPVFDRITSAPAKILMESLSRQRPAMQNCFKPLWREGIIQNSYTGSLQVVATWHVNIHKGRIRIEVLPEFLDGVEADMGPGLMRLQFGQSDVSAESATPQKGKGKGGGGKAGKAKRAGPALPLDPSMYRHEDEVIRTKLGGLQFSRYPFSVAIRKLEQPQQPAHNADNAAIRMDDATKRRQDQPAHPSKRRSPTPEATYHPAVPQQHAVAPDPWAAARSSTSTMPITAARGTAEPAVGGDLRMGDRISA